MTIRISISRTFFVLCLAFFVLFAGACGKEGLPQPKKSQDLFTFKGITATADGACMVIAGSVVGAIGHVERITLETAPIDSVGDCPGCPFVAREHQDYTPTEAHLDLDSGAFLFSFCPSTNAPMYRWRLVGKNIYNGLPLANNTPQVLIVRDTDPETVSESGESASAPDQSKK